MCLVAANASRPPGWLVLGLLIFTLLASCAAPDAPTRLPDERASAATPLAQPARIVTSEQVKGRIWDLTIDSPAVGREVKVRLLLPARFEGAKSRRWPVLYLLHGCCDTYEAWTRSTDIEKRTRNLDLLVVMPDGGTAGFYSNWRSGPAWETFHLTELGSLLTEKYRASDQRAIAGLSMGGLGALSYAARNPGMFRVAASFSGIVHTRLSDDHVQGYLNLLSSQGEDPRALWGDPDDDEEIWKAHNPYDLAPRLAGTKLFVSAGNGQPGLLDRDQSSSDEIEISIGEENDALVERLDKLGLDAQVELYGAGTHNWVYWQRELEHAWPLITEELRLR
jgi:diacylglycerol O-acyltransferase / trehalose O-mycolyltransferase